MNEHEPSDEIILSGLRRHLTGVEPLVPAPPAWEPDAARPRAGRLVAGVQGRSAYGLGGLAAAAIVLAVVALAIGPFGQRGTGPGTSATQRARTPEPSTSPVTIELQFDPGLGLSPEALATDAQAAVPVLRQRLAAFGVTGAQVDASASGHIIVRTPAAADSPELRSLFEVGRLTFVDLPAAEYGTQGSPGARPIPADGDPIDPSLKPFLGSADLDRSKVRAASDQSTGWAVDFGFTAAGTTTFAEYSTRNVDHFFAIVLDGRVLSAPYIKSPITEGLGRISGGFSARQANALAAVLASGTLPAQLVAVSESRPSTTPAPSTGAGSAVRWHGPVVVDAADQPNQAFAWSRGYLAITTADRTADGMIHLRYSADGQHWEAPVTLTPAAPGQALLVADGPSGLVAINSGTDCPLGLGACSPKGVSLWSSKDGRTWQELPRPAVFEGYSIRLLSATSSGYLALGRQRSDGPPALWFSSDGRDWARTELPAGGVDTIQAVGDGFVAAGRLEEGASNATPAAWYSSDGRSWSGGALPGASKLAFMAIVLPVTRTSASLVTLVQSGSIGPIWVTHDGRTWRVADTKLPIYRSNGAEAFTLARGPITNGSPTLQAWVTTDGVAWQQLQFAGDSVPDAELGAVAAPSGSTDANLGLLQPTIAYGPAGLLVLVGGKAWIASRG